MWSAHVASARWCVTQNWTFDKWWLKVFFCQSFEARQRNKHAALWVKDTLSLSRQNPFIPSDASFCFYPRQQSRANDVSSYLAPCLRPNAETLGFSLLLRSMLLRQAFYVYGTTFKDASVPFVTSQTCHILYYQLGVKNTLLSVNVSVITNMRTLKA